VVQGNHFTTGTVTQDVDFPPLCEEFSCTSRRPKGSLPRKKKRLYMDDNAVTVTVRQDWNITKYWQWVRSDRYHITSLCSISVAFHCWTTGYYLWTFFMQTTLIFFLNKKLWCIVWTTFQNMFIVQDSITLTGIEQHPTGWPMVG